MAEPEPVTDSVDTRWPVRQQGQGAEGTLRQTLACALVWLRMTTGKRWVASRSTGPAPHVAAGPVGRLSRSLILETGEIYLILTRPVNIGAVLDAQDGDEMYRVVDLVQDAEGPSPCGVWCELRSNGALVHAAAGALRRAQLRQGRGR